MTEPMTEARLEAIRNREQAATPGPWDYIGDNIVGVVAGCNCSPGGVDDIEGVYYHPEPPHETHIVVAAHTEGSLDYFDQYRADCRFIAECRTAIPDLLTHVNLLEGLVHDLSEESLALEVGRQLERGEVLEALQMMERNYEKANRWNPRLGVRDAIRAIAERGPALPSLPPEQVRAERDALRAALKEIVARAEEDGGMTRGMTLAVERAILAARALVEDA